MCHITNIPRYKSSKRSVIFEKSIIILVIKLKNHPQLHSKWKVLVESDDPSSEFWWSVS